MAKRAAIELTDSRPLGASHIVSEPRMKRWIVAKAALSAQPDAHQARDVMPVQGLLVRCPHIPLRILCMLFRDRQLNFLLYYL
jgi:hypothetical protein